MIDAEHNENTSALLPSSGFFDPSGPVSRWPSLAFTARKKPASKKVSNDDLSPRHSMPAMLAGRIAATR
jgi:hypothetical protein